MQREFIRSSVYCFIFFSYSDLFLTSEDVSKDLVGDVLYRINIFVKKSTEKNDKYKLTSFLFYFLFFNIIKSNVFSNIKVKIFS